MHASTARARSTGDLFSAVLTGNLLAGRNLLDAAREACDQVVAPLNRILHANSAELLSGYTA